MHARGFTLIELVIAIVIVGIAVVGVMSVYLITARSGADPAVRQQAQYIAEAYLDEILLKRFYDPDTNTVCPPNEGAANRSLYDNVCDYNTLPDTVVRNQAGTAVAGLAGYSVAVSVDSSAGVALHTVNNTGATRVLLVTVTVTHAATNTAIALSGYRTNYLCNTAGETECK